MFVEGIESGMKGRERSGSSWRELSIERKKERKERKGKEAKDDGELDLRKIREYVSVFVCVCLSYDFFYLSTTFIEDYVLDGELT